MNRTAALLLAAACARPAPVPEKKEVWRAKLVARAVMPADTFAPGPPSGRVLNPAETHGRAVPFPSQPVQGFSALLSDPDAGLLALSDNGYGTPELSADFRLRIYRVRIDGGALTWTSFIELRDPDHHAPFPIVHELTDAGRPLTGADFDPESMQQTSDGTLWIGDELGPYLLHFDTEGRLLEPPFSLPELFSPYHHRYEEAYPLKIMNALAAHAHAHGAPTPIASPWHLLIADQDPDTGAPARRGHGISSELFDVAALRKAGFDVIPWTVNDPARAQRLRELGVAGLISDRPDLIPGAQGHRGARGLRPESTLPAFEAALSLGVTTLEADLQLTKDGVPVVGHDPVLEPKKCRVPAPVAVSTLTAAEVQRVVCNKLLTEFPDQRAEAGPKATAFAKAQKLSSPFAMLTLDQLLTFAEGDSRVRFNLEIKTDFITLTDAAIAVIKRHRLESRVDIQSFDLRALLEVHRTAPELQTIALFDDARGNEPGPERLAGMAWPWRETYTALPPRVRVSGGFEGMALAKGEFLYPALEKPLVDESRHVKVWLFWPRYRRFSLALDYPLHERGVAVADLQSSSDGFIALERDDTQGDPDGFKRIFAIRNADEKTELANLNDLDDGDGGRFTFPFWTIESMARAPKGVLVMNDNNYPFSVGRHLDSGQPDDTELIHVQIWSR